MALAKTLDRLNRLARPARVGVVVGGYVAALAFAILVVAVHIARSSAADRDASSGMHAFADASLFLLAFGAASIPATGLALHYLRSVRGFWTASAAVAMLVAISGVGSALAIADPRVAAAIGSWSTLAVPRILVAPAFAGLFALSSAFSPSRGNRWCLIGAAAMECVTSLVGALRWFLPLVAGGGA